MLFLLPLSFSKLSAFAKRYSLIYVFASLTSWFASNFAATNTTKTSSIVIPMIMSILFKIESYFLKSFKKIIVEKYKTSKAQAKIDIVSGSGVGVKNAAKTKASKIT